jgi:hypothetical protein
MANIAASNVPVQIESVETGNPTSESLFASMGAAINFCLFNTMPVGTVIDSMLTLAAFQSQTGTNWILADGSNVAGSAYQTLTSNTNVPDLRGIFTRGKNNGRSDGYQNPDGDLALGTLQSQQFGAHNHPLWTGSGNGSDYAITLRFGGGFGPNVGGTYSNTNDVASGNLFMSEVGGDETRPTVVTVNKFIRIN